MPLLRFLYTSTHFFFESNSVDYRQVYHSCKSIALLFRNALEFTEKWKRNHFFFIRLYVISSLVLFWLWIRLLKITASDEINTCLDEVITWRKDHKWEEKNSVLAKNVCHYDTYHSYTSCSRSMQMIAIGGLFHLKAEQINN